MIKRLLPSILFLFISTVTHYVQATNVSGTIVNGIWTSNNSPYIVIGNVNIAGLRIGPGVTVSFASNYTFEVDGTLSAQGTPNAPIVFTGTKGGWQGIFFNNALAGSQLSCCSISGAVNSGVRLVQTPAPTIVQCSFSGNSTAGNGGAIDAESQTGDLVLNGCTFQDNSASNHGGAVRALMTSGTLRVISGCRFIGNTANPGSLGGDYVGGAIYVSGNVEISESSFTNNTSISACAFCTVTGRGGAVFLESGDAVIKNCVFVANTVMGLNASNCNGEPSRAWGGAIYLNNGTLELSNTILSHNVTDAPYCGTSTLGGGLFVNSGNCSVVNVTCAYNTGDNTDSGINVSGGTTGITNSIIFFNDGSQISGTATVVYSDVQGGYSGEGNISGNPIFLSPSDLVIVPGSPCINAGNTNAIYENVYFPPSIGHKYNDIGAHGGPGAGAILQIQSWPQIEVSVFGGVPGYSVPGYNYLLQASTNLSSTNWQTVQQFQIAHVGDATNYFEATTNTLSQRFYRLNLAP